MLEIMIEKHSSMNKDILKLQKRIVVLASLAWDTSCEVEVCQGPPTRHVNSARLESNDDISAASAAAAFPRSWDSARARL